MNINLNGIARAALLLPALLATMAAAQPGTPGGSAAEAWTGAPEQRLWGLMQVWSETKGAFPHFGDRPGLDWDAAARASIPRVLAAPDVDAYYDVLMELVAGLRDGHTLVLPPWGYVRPDFDGPALELQAVDGRILVARAAGGGEVEAAGLVPGTEIISVEKVPVRRWFDERVLRIHGRGVPQADEAINLYHLLQGPRGSRVNLTVRNGDGADRDVALTRGGADGEPFAWRFVEWAMIAQHLQTRRLEDGVRYVAIPSFSQPHFVDEFLALVDSTAGDGTRALIIDLRYNLGGNSQDAEAMMAALINEPAATAIMRYPHRVPALRAWGQEEPWSERSWTVAPREGRRFSGPLVILTGGATNSSAEDFVLMLRGAGRASVVGGPTAGSSGNALVTPLPGGGQLRVSTFAARCPDGTAYVGKGLEPDVLVTPDAADVAAGRDPVLSRGLAVAAALAAQQR